jgi:hypothetical protein
MSYFGLPGPVVPHRRPYVLPDIHGEHGGVAQHEHLETGISGGRDCGDAHGVAGMLTPMALLAAAIVMCGKPGCLDRLRRAQLDAAALAMMSPVGVAPPRLGWPGPCALLRTVTTGPSRGARYPPYLYRPGIRSRSGREFAPLKSVQRPLRHPRTCSGRRPCLSHSWCSRRFSADGHGRAALTTCSVMMCNPQWCVDPSPVVIDPGHHPGGGGAWRVGRDGHGCGFQVVATMRHGGAGGAAAVGR